ncbi:hypothetical protein Dimus_005248, partial [Dionaea muscipula]
SASSLRSVGSRLSRALSFVDDSNSSINGEVGRRRQQDTGGGDSSGSDEFPSGGGDSRAEDPSARGDWRAARWRTGGASSEPGGGVARANGGVEGVQRWAFSWATDSGEGYGYGQRCSSG